MGVGATMGYNGRDRSAGGVVIAPVGKFGGRLGCVNEICFFACITVKIC